jgi:hypothetical protein
VIFGLGFGVVGTGPVVVLLDGSGVRPAVCVLHPVIASPTVPNAPARRVRRSTAAPPFTTELDPSSQPRSAPAVNLRSKFDLAQFGDRCSNFSQFGVPILYEFGEVDLQVVQLCKAGIGMTGAGDPLG